MEIKKIPFERTYRKMSNLDDRYENGAHDLLKFIKFDMEELQTTHQKILELNICQEKMELKWLKNMTMLFHQI